MYCYILRYTKCTIIYWDTLNVLLYIEIHKEAHHPTYFYTLINKLEHREHLDSHRGFCVGSMLFILVVFLCFVYIRPVSCVSNVASVSGVFMPILSVSIAPSFTLAFIIIFFTDIEKPKRLFIPTNMYLFFYFDKSNNRMAHQANLVEINNTPWHTIENVSVLLINHISGHPQWKQFFTYYFFSQWSQIYLLCSCCSILCYLRSIM